VLDQYRRASNSDCYRRDDLAEADASKMLIAEFIDWIASYLGVQYTIVYV